MELFQLSDLEAEHGIKGDLYIQFISHEKLSVGLYNLKVGSLDSQKPHLEDEVYFVLRGQGAIRVGTDTQEIKPGSIVYVRAGVDHKFSNIKEDLELLVFFAPVHKPA